MRSQQYEREKELSDHAVVIKELQKVIGNERIAKEQLENQVCSCEVFSYEFATLYNALNKEPLYHLDCRDTKHSQMN